MSRSYCRRWRVAALLSALLSVAALGAGASAAQADSHGAHWTYSGATVPEHWASEGPAFAACGSGKHQSPIDIENAAREELPAIEFAYRPIPLTVTDTGHSF